MKRSCQSLGCVGAIVERTKLGNEASLLRVGRSRANQDERPTRQDHVSRTQSDSDQIPILHGGGQQHAMWWWGSRAPWPPAIRAPPRQPWPHPHVTTPV
ncbi:hypothetical protein BHM03_00027099 [Ensete ventricosum]|nr:hypothetical protein BHM03_00027099 [Ensete ventricosum]